MLELLWWCLQRADRTCLGLEETRVAPLVSTLVDQFPLLALIKRHPADWADASVL